jgi:hypothetical protein
VELYCGVIIVPNVPLREPKASTMKPPMVGTFSVPASVAVPEICNWSQPVPAVLPISTSNEPPEPWVKLPSWRTTGFRRARGILGCVEVKNSVLVRVR